MAHERRHGDPIGSCHGYVVVADDGWLGEVETPLYASESDEPDYLVLRVHADGTVRRALVPVSLVRSVDVGDALVHVRGSVVELARLPATLPLAPASRAVPS